MPSGDLSLGAFFSADGKYIAVASGKAAVYIVSVVTKRLIKTLSVGTSGVAAPVSFSPDDKTLYVIDPKAGKMYDVDIATGKQLHVYPLPAGSYLSWTLGSRVAGALNSKETVVEYDLATGQVYARVPDPGTAPVKAVYTDGTGRYIVISDSNGVAYLVDAVSKKVVATFRYPLGGVNAYPEISLDGNTVYVPGGGTAAGKLWDAATKSYITPADARWPALDSGVTFSTDSRFALTSSTTASEVVDVWDIATHSLDAAVTVPKSPDEEIIGVGPGGDELFSTGSLDASKGTFTKLVIWALPA